MMCALLRSTRTVRKAAERRRTARRGRVSLYPMLL
jgi:hypothetical protein